jgi:hypothetical protein
LGEGKNKTDEKKFRENKGNSGIWTANPLITNNIWMMFLTLWFWFVFP